MTDGSKPGSGSCRLTHSGLLAGSSPRPQLAAPRPVPDVPCQIENVLPHIQANHTAFRLSDFHLERLK